MSTIATLFVKLGLDASGYSSGLDAASAKMQNVGKSMMRVGGMMTAGLTLPIVGAGAAMVKAASDLEESANAVNVVYGDSAKIIEDYGKTVATTAGMATSDFNQIAATTGAFLKNVGFDLQGAAEETITLTERASDMASIFNTDVNQALQAILSGLKGEFNPLEQFGVKMNAAMIEAKALSMGLVDTAVDMGKVDKASFNLEMALADTAKKQEKFGEGSIEVRKALQKEADAQEALEKAMMGATGDITDTMKAQAALALVYEQTDQFAGDFANTSDGLANSTRIVTAQLKDQAAALGAELLPYVLQVVQGIAGLVEKFQALTPEQKKFGLIIAGVLAVIGPLVTFIGGLVTAISAAIPVITAIAGVLTFPLIAIILAVIAVVALLVAAWANNWGGIREKTAEVAKWIETRIRVFLMLLKMWWEEHGQSIMNVVTALWMQIKIIIDKGLVVIKALFAVFKAAFEGDWYTFGVKLREYWAALWDLIATAVTFAWANLKLLFGTMISNTIKLFKEADWGKIGRDIIAGIGNGLLAASGWLRDTAISVGQGVADAFKGFFGINSPSTLMENLIGKNLALGLVVGMENNLTPQALQPAMSGVSASVSGASSVSGGGAEDNAMMDALMNMIRNLPDDIKRGNRDLVTKLGGR